jgi:hypothetical protein
MRLSSPIRKILRGKPRIDPADRADNRTDNRAARIAGPGGIEEREEDDERT